MARPIDEKIVAMKMDNSDFKKKAVETTGLFGKLRDSLSKIPSTNLGNISRDLGGIQRAANGTDLSGIAKAVDNISGRFSALGVMATTVLVNMTNKAVEAGTRMWKGLTTDPIMDGFREYETKMGSIQTILANTQADGTKLDDVKRALEDLNEYSDKTIYNFAEMTKNIGLFTNAGLGLTESTSMIKGFSNAAAASGANAENAAHAAYQLSQGLSSGVIIQQDWMSLTNAGMGNDNMKRDLIAIAHASGDLGMEWSADETIGDWKTMLTKKKWLTSDVMSTYLQAMAGDINKAELMTLGLTDAQADLMVQNAKTGQDAATKVRTFTQLMNTLQEGVGSGWATSFELIFGDFEQATKLWSGVNDFIGPFIAKTGESRNDMLRKVFREGDGLKNLFGGLKNILTPIGQVLGAVGSGFKKAFPPANANMIKKLLESFKNFTGGLKLSEGAVGSLKTIFAGFFSVFAIGWNIIKGVASIIMGLIPSFGGLGSKILELIAKVANIPISLDKVTESGDAFKAVMETLKKVAGGIAGVLTFAVSGMINFVDTVGMVWDILAKGDFKGGPWEEDSKIVDKLFTIRETVVEVVGAIKQAWNILTKGDFTGGPWEEDSKIVDFLFSIREGFSSMGASIKSIKWSSITASFSNFFDTIISGYDWVVDKLSGVGEAIKNALPDGNKIFAGGFIAGLIAVVGFGLKMAWDFYQVFTGWGSIGSGVAEVLEGVGGALEGFTMQLKAQALLTIAIAVGVLAASLWVMSGLDSAQIARGLYAIIGSLTALVLAMAMMDKFKITGTGMQTAIQIVALSIAFSILAGAIKKMSGLNWNEIAKGIVGLAGVMLTFAGAIAIMSKFGSAKVGASALQFIGLAIAINILFEAVKKFGEADEDVLVQGLKSLGIILLSLGLFLAVAGRSKFGAASALGVMGISVAIMLMVGSIEKLGEMDVDVLQQGLETIGYILLAISAFSLLTGTVGLLSTSAGLVLVAAALTLLMVPIATLGNMDLATLAIGIGAIAVVLVAIGAASMLMTGMMAAGAGLILLAIGLNLLVIPIAALGAMGWGPLLTGIFGLALGLAVIGGTAALLGMIAPLILAFGVALVVVGAAMLLAGAGMALFSAGLVSLAAMTGAAITTIVAMLGTLILGLISLIPMGIEFAVKLITQIVDALALHGPKLFDKMSELALTMLDKLTLKLPQFIEKGTALVIALQDGIGLAVPALITNGIEFMIQLMDGMAKGISDNGPKITESFMNVMGEILLLMVETGTAMVIALFGWIPGVKGAATKIGETAEQHIRDNFLADKVAGEKVEEFSTGLTSRTGLAANASKNVSEASRDAAGSVAFKPTGSGLIDEMIGGIDSKKGAAEISSKGIANAGKTAMGSVDTASTGVNFGEGFAGGMSSSSVIDKVVSAGLSIAGAAVRAVRNFWEVKSPSKLAKRDGGHFGEGLAIGIDNKKPRVAKSAASLASSAKKGFNDAMDKSEYKFKMGIINSAQYISEIKKIRSAYSKYPEMVRTANLEIQKVEKGAAKHREDLRKKQDDAEKARFDAAKKRIDDLKYYNELSLTEELTAMQKLSAKAKKGSEERASAEREIYRIKNEINSKLIAINDEYVAKAKEANNRLIDGIKALNDEYKAAFESRKKELVSFASLFEKVEMGSETTGKQLLDNLRGQTDVFVTWSTNLRELGKKGINQGLLEELRAMGPKAAVELAALNTLTSEQLKEYSHLWEFKDTLASNQARNELEVLKKDTATKIQELTKATAKELESYKKEWITKITDIRHGVTNQMVPLTAGMSQIGRQSIQGLIAGMGGMEKSLQAQATKMANVITGTIKNTLKIKSPSRVAIQDGGYFGQGLVIGMANKVKDVAYGAKALALTAKDSLNQFLEGFEIPEEDNELHFKAVIDYDKLDTKGFGKLRHIMPDTSFTTNSVTATKAMRRQNDNKRLVDTTIDDKNKQRVKEKDGVTGQPIIIQSILDGRVIAEQTYEYTSELMGGRTGLGYAMKGL